MRFVKYTLVGLISITLAFLSLGFFHTEFKYVNELDINASPEKVYVVFTNEELKSKWLSGYSGSETLAGVPSQSGHRKLLTFKQEEQTFEIIEELTEVHEGEKIVFTLETELFKGVNEVYFMGNDQNSTLNTYLIYLNKTRYFQKLIL